MTKHTAEALLMIRDALTAVVADRDEPAAKPEPPRKHAVTVVWCEGDEPGEALVMGNTTGLANRAQMWSFAARALGVDPSPNPDAAKARAALVRLAASGLYTSTPGSCFWTHKQLMGCYQTKTEAISLVCRENGCIISVAEVEAILGAGS